MSVAPVILLFDITLIYHAARTGRLQPWAFHHPDGAARRFQSAEAHLLYARPLAEVGRVCEGLEEYHAVCAYFFPVPRRAFAIPAAAHGRPHRRGEGGVQRAPAVDEACAEISARRAGRMAFDRRETVVSL